MYLVMLKELQEKSGHRGCDANEEINDYEENISCAGHLKPERGWIHDGGYRPARKREREMSHFMWDFQDSNKTDKTMFVFIVTPCLT